MVEIQSGGGYRDELPPKTDIEAMRELIARTGKIGIELGSIKVGEKVPLLEAALTMGTQPKDIMLYTAEGAFTFDGFVHPREWTSDEERCWKWIADHDVFPKTTPSEIIISANYAVRDPLDV
jgi:hypothetical protein